MSTASKITFCASVTFTIGIITYVHHWQKKERERLRDGVIRDLERQQQKRVFQEQDTRSESAVSEGSIQGPDIQTLVKAHT